MNRTAGTDTAAARVRTDTVPAADAAAPAPCRGRPRNAAADTAIIEAVLRMIEDGVSIGELSMERIAREAGSARPPSTGGGPARASCCST